MSSGGDPMPPHRNWESCRRRLTRRVLVVRVIEAKVYRKPDRKIMYGITPVVRPDLF